MSVRDHNLQALSYTHNSHGALVHSPLHVNKGREGRKRKGNLEAKSHALQFTGKMIKEKVNTLSQLVSEYLAASRGADHQRFGLRRFAFTVCLLRQCPLEGVATRGGAGREEGSRGEKGEESESERDEETGKRGEKRRRGVRALRDGG